MCNIGRNVRSVIFADIAKNSIETLIMHHCTFSNFSHANEKKYVYVEYTFFCSVLEKISNLKSCVLVIVFHLKMSAFRVPNLLLCHAFEDQQAF